MLRCGFGGGIGAIFALAMTACAALAEGPVTVSVDAARAAAVTAWQRGDLVAAARLAQILLENDATDPLAHYVLALTAVGSKNLSLARQEARLAYRHGRTDLQRQQAALVAANVASVEGRGVALRYWLRQATAAATTPGARARGKQALAAIRQQSPWSTSFRFSLTPSSNVNGGSDSPFNIIDGVPLVGVLDGDAQALSGVVGMVQARLGYRLAQSATSETRITAALNLKRVELSSGAKAQAVTLTGADLATSHLELGLSHMLRPAGMRGTLGFDLGLGFGENGDGSGSRSLSFGLSRGFEFGPLSRLEVAGSYELEQATTGREAMIRSTQISFGLRQRRDNGDTVGTTLALFHSGADLRNSRRQGLYLRSSYDLAAPVGLFSLSGGLGGTYTEYPDYVLGFIAPPGGRKDKAVFAEINVSVEDLSWAGFAPQLTLRASRTDSNISRYDQSEFGVVIGLKSLF